MIYRLCNLQEKPQNTISEEKEKEEIETEGNNEAHTYNLCDLPFDILELIASKLFLVDHTNFRSVCNTFRLVAPFIKWSEASFKFESQTLFPWFTIPDGNSYAIHNFIDPHPGSRYLMNVPDYLSDGTVHYSKDGWLLIRNPNFMFFYHPFRKMVMKLPQEGGHHFNCMGYGLSSSPTLAKSILVGSSLCSIYYLHLVEGSRRNEYQSLDYFHLKINHNNPIYFGGAFYFLGRDGQLSVFELKDG